MTTVFQGAPTYITVIDCCCGPLKIQKNTLVAPLIPQPPLSTRPATKVLHLSASIVMINILVLSCVV